MNKDTCKDSKKIEKYRSNPFTNSKEDYYNEIIQKIICSILVSKNIKKINCLVFDLLFDFFMKIIKTIGINCRNFSFLRGSVVVNYIDIKCCLKLAFSNIYNEIYTLKKYNMFNNFIFDIVDNVKKYNYINVVQNSYLYYKHLCMKKNEKSDFLNEFNNMNYLNTKNYLTLDCSSTNENVNVLFLNENIDIEKYKEIMKLKKKYMHDHMPIIPLSMNIKEKKTGYIQKIESCDDFSSSNLSSESSSSSSSYESSKESKNSDYFDEHEEYTNEDISKEKIEILNLLPKLKEIYIQNKKKTKDLKNSETFLFNSINTFETFE
ncbi:conserved Plasmodium protein, unknown function [Plasmodium gallinaceum]|uniref:Uncharacterized protein n=1 Tax=Plasmodium gallinaceum TaxID=5849 RepID=A0A1J1GZM6_PLAGA|nr:conserved Plasmodium protein, unknown function [Plasmodium gallinaceum]CRG97927.1 conserved Plasmodium protein, unknown function [Plasmodium gallinaceum]